MTPGIMGIGVRWMEYWDVESGKLEEREKKLNDEG